jgi:glyceraldehyde 3-phosphate dehydrogenase
VNDRAIDVYACMSPRDIPWAACDARYIVESTDAFTTVEKATDHLTAGAEKVAITAPSKVHDNFTILEGLMTTVHATTVTQKTVEALRRRTGAVGAALHQTSSLRARAPRRPLAK